MELQQRVHQLEAVAGPAAGLAVLLPPLLLLMPAATASMCMLNAIPST
jgi:hypothetical protein